MRNLAKERDDIKLQLDSKEAMISDYQRELAMVSARMDEV